MSKRFLIAANWKMHSPPPGFDIEDSPYRKRPDVDVIVFPTMLHIRECIDASLETGGQYGHYEASGAHTGDVGMRMLQEAGCSAVLCGHSERRQQHGETDDVVVRQVEAALKASLLPILCIGETKREKEAGMGQDTLRRQLSAFKPGCVLAYEPVWAIGTGESADPAYALQMHTFIRLSLPKDLQQQTKILYGGSANGENAAAFLSQPHIDGLLVGGASLKPQEFGAIVEAAVGLSEK